MQISQNLSTLSAAAQVFIIAFQDEDLNLSFKELWHTKRGITTCTSAIVALIGMLPFVYIEVRFIFITSDL